MINTSIRYCSIRRLSAATLRSSRDSRSWISSSSSSASLPLPSLLMLQNNSLRAAFFRPKTTTRNLISSSTSSLLPSSFTLLQNNHHRVTTLCFRTKTTTTATTVTQHEPPLPLRIALVSSTTALCTPAFPAIGFLNLVLRFVLPDKQLRSIVSGSWGTIISFATFTLVPALYNIAPILLPFALGNGVCAGMAYGILDITTGGPKSKVLRNPLLAGGCLGAVTGVVAPYFFYGHAFSLLYGIDSSSMTESIRMILNFPMVTEICGGTGFVAGLSIYPLLKYPMTGIQGVHWMNLSALLLLASGVGLYYIYTPGDAFPMPSGIYVDPKLVPVLDSIIRYDSKTNELYTYSLQLKRNVGPPDLCGEGRIEADKVRKYHANSNNDYKSPQALDNQVLAWLYYVLDKDIATRHPDHVVSVAKDVETILEEQDNSFRTDGIVSFILERSMDSKTKQGSDDYTTTKKLTELLEKIQKLNGDNKNKNRKREDNHKKIMSIEAVSTAVELLLILHKKDKDLLNSKRMINLEKSVRQRCPGIIIYKEEEGRTGEKTKQSIESQLKQSSWNGGNLNTAFSSLSRWEHLAKQEQQRVWVKRAGTAVLVSVGGLFVFFFSNN